MNRISDPLLARLLAHGSDPALPPPVVAPTFRMMSLILAARSFSTIGAVSIVAKLAGGRFAVPLGEQGWFLSFGWDYDVNLAHNLRLENWHADFGDEGDP